MEQGKKAKKQIRIHLRNTIRQKLSFRRVLVLSVVSAAFIALMVLALNFSGPKSAMAVTTTEPITIGSFIVDMGKSPQTYANGLIPYGLLYDMVMNYQIPVKWVIEPTKAKDGTDFTYNSINYKGGPFIIPKEYITSAVTTRITSWISQGVQGVYTTGSLSVPVYATITYFPLVMIDQLSGNDGIIRNYYTNAGIPSSAYQIGTPSGLNSCYDVWVNPHGDPTWATHNFLINYTTNQKGYIWSQCHAVSVMEGTRDPVTPANQLNFLTSSGLQCYSSGKCTGYVTETHAGNSTPAYTYYYPADPVMQFIGTMDGATKNGSEKWYQPISTGGWRTNAQRLVTTATGTSPKEGVLMVYGPAFGNAANGWVMYEAGHSFNSGGGAGTEAERVAAQRAYLNFTIVAGLAKQISVSGQSIPLTFTGLQPKDVSVSVGGGSPPFTYHWTSTVAGYFYDSTAASTSFIPSNTTASGVIRCIITDACGRVNFVSQFINVTASPLPITLTSFSAQAINNSVTVRWITASELNNDYFTLERSIDGNEYSQVTWIKGAGTSSVNHYYSYADDDPMDGSSYYRLKQTDFDGRFEIFNPVAVKIERNPNVLRAIKIFPNPISSEFTAEFNSEVTKTVTVELLTLKSKVIYSQKINLEQGNNSYHFDAGSAIEPGVYVFRILDENSVLGFAKVIKK